jgi:ABC-type antimicrobial peptide transport system permease subunit
MSTFNLKLPIRNLLKAKLYTGINIIGLSVGIAAVILIYRIITFELSFNKNFKNYDRIVRVVREIKIKSSGEKFKGAGMPLPAMELLKKDIPQFKVTAKVKENWPTIAVPNPNGGAPLKKFNPEEGEQSYFVEPSFFEIFDYTWLEGNPQSVLKDVNTIVLTKTLAEKFFGDYHKAMGQLVSLDNLQPYVKVEGVIEDPVSTQDLNVTSFVSYLTFRAHKEYFRYEDEWGSTSSNDQFYALMQDPNQIDQANKVLAGVGQEQYKDDKAEVKHIVQPLSDIHYNEDIGNAGGQPMNKKKLVILALIGFLTLIMACFNFINMANAQSVSRLKEVGIRKTLGVGNGQLMSGFLFETGLLVGVSILIGVLISFFATRYLHYVSPLPKEIQLFTGFGLVYFLLGLWMAVTLLAGLYPATVLTSFQPVKIFRSDFDKGFGSGVVLRKILVVLQFVIAFGLIISTIIALSQLSYIRNMSLGYNKELVYTFGFNSDSSSNAKINTLKNKLKDIATVETVSVCSDKPTSNNTWSSNWRLSSAKEDAPFNISMKFCDEDYLKTYDLKLLAGRWLAASDTSREAVLNRTSLKRLGITDFNTVLGTKVRLGSKDLNLVGVVEDYQSHSAHQPLEALLMTTIKEFYSVASVKIRSGNIHSSIQKIENVYNELFPEQVFKGEFLDDEIQKFYEADTQFGSLIKGFASLAVIISCLGLFALASFTITRRIKEIGVRKVLGATTQNIVSLISKDFLTLVLIAFVIAAPLSYYFMNKWLMDFVQRTTISWWMFVIAVILVTGIAFLTVGFQAVKAAWTNPVKSLRSE